MGAAVQTRLEHSPDRTVADLEAGRYDPYLDAQTLERLKPRMSTARVHSNVNDIAGRAAGGGDLADRIITAESGNRADAKNPLSSASGAGQFIDSTWLDQVKRNAPEIAAGKTDAEILALRGDRALSKRMVQSYTEDNRQALASQGLPTDDGSLYLAHYLGASGAAKVLSADTATPMASLVSADVLSANPSLKHMTAGDLRQMTAAKMGVGGAAPAPAPPAIDTQIAEAQHRVDAGKLTPEEGDRVIGGLTRRYHEWSQRTAQDRAQLVNVTANGIAMLESGRDWHEDRGEILRLLPPEKAAETLRTIDEAREFGAAKNRVQWATPAELNDQGAEIKRRLANPQDFARNRRYAEQWQKVVNDRADALDPQKGDPAAYVATAPVVAAARQAADNPADPQNRTPGIEAAIQATLAEQERLGVAEQHRRALTKPKAAAIVQEIVNTDPAKANMGALLHQAEREYGRYWPLVWGDLVRGGLPAEAQMLGAMDRPDQVAARADYQRVIGLIAEKGGAKHLEEAAGAAHTLIDHGLDERLSEFRATVSADPRLYDAVKDSVKYLAYYYAFQGRSAEAALRDAYDGLIGRKYDFDGTIRAPKGMLGILERAGEVVLAELTRKPPPEFDTTQAEGMTKPGNLDPWQGAARLTAALGYSTTNSMVLATDAGHVLIPTFVAGQALAPWAAKAHFTATGENLGTFATAEAANAYATALQKAQASMYDTAGNPKLGVAARGGNLDLTPEQRQAIYLSGIQRGTWQTNENETGLYRTVKLRDGFAGPALRADGSRIEFKFTDAPGLAAKTPPAGADISRGIASAPM
jgi:hypothetical protein